MSTETGSPATSPDASEPKTLMTRAERKAVVLATLGGVMEWYDFNIYGYVAIMVSQNIFSNNDNDVSALLATFATFGIGFVARPLGAVIFGIIADRKGRKMVMLVSMLLMAIAALIMGVCPNYSAIGAWAPALFVFARLMQGFSAGGEFGSSAVFLTEWAPPKRRGFFGSFQQVSAMGGLLCGVTISAILTAALGQEVMLDWGWRVPFLIGALLAVFVFYMRRGLEETPIYQKMTQQAAANKLEREQQLQNDPKISIGRGFFVSMGVAALMAAGPYITLTYMPTFAQKVVGVAAGDALWATVVAAAAILVLAPTCGALSDKLGRRKFVMAAAVGWLVLSVPLFLMITNGGTFVWVLFGQLLFQIPVACLQGTGTAAVSEVFATGKRGTWVSISTAVGNAVFGGFAPYIATLLVSSTGIAISPAFYVMAIALLALAAGILMPERASLALHD